MSSQRIVTLKAVNKPKPTEEIGAPGLKEVGGFLQEEFVIDLRGQRGAQRYREMADNCPAVDAALTTMRNSCRRAIADGRVEPFSTKSEDVQRAEFVEECFGDMCHSRSDMDTEALTMFEYGYAPLNIVYKRRQGFNKDEEVSSRFSDGAVGWKKVSLRAQESVFRWEFDELGQRTLAMTQIPAPTYQEFTIPMDRLALFRTTAVKNNPEGRSLLRAAWFAYHFFKRGTTIGWVGAERDVTGIPLLKGPADLFSQQPTAEQSAGLARLKQIGENVRNDEQACVLLPSDVDPETKVPMYDFSLVSSPGSKVTDVSGMTRDQERQILMVLFSDFLLMGHEKIGTQALFVGRVGLYSMQLDALLERYDDTINRQMIPRLALLNGWPMDRMPRFVHGSVSEKSLDELAKFLSAYTSSGGVLDPGLDEYVREMAGWPAAEAEGLDLGDVGTGSEEVSADEEVDEVEKGDVPGHEFHGNQYTAAVSEMSAGKINRELDKVEQERSELADEMIAAGRGHEKSSETAKKTDPLSVKVNENHSREYDLRQEIRNRYGSNIRRLPSGRGFGPLKKSWSTRQRRGRFAPGSGDVLNALTLLRDRQRTGGGDSISHGMDVATEYPFSASRDYRDEVEVAPIEEVPISGLRATQPNVRRDRVRDFIENPGVVPSGKRNLTGVLEDVPVVFETEAGRFVQDGHHRLAAAKLLGRKSVRARVVRDQIAKGDVAGHEFHGNQWTGGGGGGTAKSSYETISEKYGMKLSQKEIRAVKAYTSPDYLDINGSLRGVREPGAKTKETITNLDSAFGNTPELSEELVVYRGLGTKAEALIGKVGTTFHDGGYSSTSSDSNVAGIFSSNRLLRIRVPKGGKVLPIDRHTGSQNRELLLPRGTKYRVTGVSKKSIDLEVIV